MSDTLEAVIGSIDKGAVAPLYLLWGEEFLVRQGADELIKHLIPDCSPGLNFAQMDGGSPREVAQELATLPLFPGRKVVYLRDPEFLAPRKGRGDALGKAKEAWKNNRRKEAARRVLAIVSRVGWSAQALDPGGSQAPGVERWKEELNIELADADLEFLREVAAFCQEEGISAPEGDDTALLRLFEQGLPGGHALVIAASDVDAKNPLVRVAKESGVVIERKIATKLKDLDVSDWVAQVLKPFGKRLGPGAEKLLKDRCGGNMRLLQSELEKLALHATGQVIQEVDVDQLVEHAREEEFLELSDALQKRDFSAALHYVQEASAQGAAPLALLGAITSIVRTLVINHERMIQLAHGKPPRSYNEFKDRVFPSIEAESRSAKGKPPHPYAAFMAMQAAAGFRREELLRGLAACAEADLALKLGGGTLVVERLLWTLCARMPPWDTGLAAVRRDLERS